MTAETLIRRPAIWLGSKRRARVDSLWVLFPTIVVPFVVRGHLFCLGTISRVAANGHIRPHHRRKSAAHECCAFSACRLKGNTSI
ncbi:hypothetical protein ACFPRL_08415 [Pseudoclavibacter helvolus]